MWNPCGRTQGFVAQVYRWLLQCPRLGEKICHSGRSVNEDSFMKRNVANKNQRTPSRNQRLPVKRKIIWRVIKFVLLIIRVIFELGSDGEG